MAPNMDNRDPKDLVRRGYIQISFDYRGDSVSRDRGYFAWLDALTTLVAARWLPHPTLYVIIDGHDVIVH